MSKGIENIQHEHNISNANLNEETNPNPVIDPIRTKKKIFIIIGTISFVLLVISISLIIYFIFHPINQKITDINMTHNSADEINTNKIDIMETIIEDIPTQKPKFEKEVFATKKTYPSNRLFIFSGEQLTEMKAEGEKMNKSNSYHNFSQTSDFIFITRDSFVEENKETLIEKIWYTGYIAIFNLIIPNSTHDNHIIYDENLINYLNISEKEPSSRDIYYINNGSNYCFAKIDFYHNGEIKNIYLPKGFLLEHYSYIKENIKLLIPKISQNLYVDSIENKLNEIAAEEENLEDLYEYNVTDYSDFVDNYEEGENFLRNLNFDKRVNKYPNIIYLNRRLSDNFNNYSNYLNNTEIPSIYEDFLTKPLSKSINYEFREANAINDSLQDIYTNFFTEGIIDNYTDINELKNNNYTNLTEYSIKSIENDELKMEGGLVNTTIYSIIDEEGFLQSVIEKSTSMMKSPEEEGDNKLDEDTNALYNQIYNDENQLSLNEVLENYDESSQQNNISFGLSFIYVNSSYNINCTDHFVNEEINKKLYEYFDNFTYELYNDTINNTDIGNNIFSSSSENINNDIRYLSEEENSVGYYGMKKITYMKEAYNYNLIGMKMEGQMYSEINPSTGKTCAYSIIKFGNKNRKIKLKDHISNYHIILERSNQMGYHLLKLIEQTNNELIQRNENYSEIIIEFEKNFTKFFEEYCDYSNLFRESLNDLYNQVRNFSGEFFYELIYLINRVYYNYTIILMEVKNNEYDFINRIREVTKDEYINYIYDMLDILENFENKTIKFLNDIDNELNKIEDFQIDLLYDITDQIYESELIFKKFNRNLFNSIEKGILTFKYDIDDHIDKIIGELLYITDFLAVNINKNEILINAIDENTRKDVSIKLKDFRNIIIIIMDLLINNINNDFEKEMNIENNKSIKYISNEKALKFLSNIENKSEHVINKIKSRINNINIYEAYSKNNDIINDINNKTFIEFINDIYSNVIYKALNITPEYLDKNSDINKNKDILFNTSNKIIETINNEIIEINNYIFSYSNQYLEKNIYNIYYNLYYFRKYFLDDEMSKLLNEFYLLLNRTIKVHFIKMIDYNFNLANQYFKEEDHYFTKYRREDRRFLTSGFIKRYQKYKAKFEQYLYLTYSEDFFNLLEKYYYQLKNDILKHVKNKIFSVNVSYFNYEYYNKAFYFHEQANNEILKIIDNINKYYNEYNIEANIKIKAVNLIEKILNPYHDKKIKELDKYYKYLYGRTTDYNVKSSDDDFVYSYWRFFKGWKNKYIYNKYQKNINKVLKDLKETDKYLSDQINIIFNNFISKFDKYINQYVIYCQNLYSHLKKYVENKINNSSTKILIENFFDIYNKIIKNDSNKGLLSKINNQVYYIRNNIDTCINKFSGNIKLLNDQYYNLYYLPNYTSFLEYPEEIIYKINQFYEEALFNIDNIKIIINYIYKQRIIYIIKSTNKYINDFIKSYFNYIKININSSYIFDHYSSSKITELDNLYKKCTININNFDINNKNISFLDSYDDEMKMNIDYIRDYILFLENITNENFIDEICNDNMGIFPNDRICHREKKKFNVSYSKYNYNVIKIRTGIYYTKTLLENIDTLFDEYNFHNIINNNKINIYDELLNDKNIIDVYNKTNYKIKEINEESNILINETYQYFLEDMKKKYTIKNDYLPFEEKLKKIIKFEDDNYTIFINNILNETNYGINSIMNEFNQTLLYQINISQNYNYYNLDKEYFKNIYYNYELNIKNIFNKNRENITNLNKSYFFHNCMKSILSRLQLNKRKYFRDTINNYSKDYDFELFNITYNLGDKIEKLLEKEYIDYEFNFIYNYVEIFENFTQNYINKIIKHINYTENKTIKIFENIYNNFYNIFKNNASSLINPYFIKQLKNNQTRCELYINYTDSEYFENDNNSKYINITNNINYIFFNCLNFNNINENDKNNNSYTLNINYNLSEKILYISNVTNNCSGFFFDLQNDTYYSDTLQMMECYKNNYFIINYTFIYFYNFNNDIKENLYNIQDKMNNLLIKNRLDENSLYDFLENNWALVPYENIDLSDMSYIFEDMENTINYVNIIKNEEYKKYLSDNLINSFKISYNYFIDNFILDELLDSIIIQINNKLEIHLDFIIKKIEDEYKYYLIILNTTDEMGYSSKMALINLYEKIKIQLNDTIFYLFEEDINFYLDLFYRENKKMFRNNFLNYYINNINEYNITLYKLEKFADELILDSNFNKTLNNISEYLMEDKIITKIKGKINESINKKIQNLYNIIKTYKINLEKRLNRITTRPLPPDMNRTNELIINYTNLVKNQKNRYYLNISDKPFNILTEFVEGQLEPPLALIKEQYRTIEERLLNETFAIINKFPNYYLVVKENLDLEMMNQNITKYINYTNETIFDYIEILDKSIKTYINKLIHYTYISGLYYIDSPCNDSFCYNESEILDNDNNTDIFDTTKTNKENDNIRKLKQNKILNGLFNFTKLDKEKINKSKNKKLRKLEEYDSTKGSITENDINNYILDLQNILYNFNKSYLNKEFKDINRYYKSFMDKINNTYLLKLKRSIEMVGFKFKTIFTEDSYKIFDNKLFGQYNKISYYIFNNSKIIEFTKNEFINTINGSSILIGIISNIAYIKINNYYKLFYRLINDQLEFINKEDEVNINLLRLLSIENNPEEDGMVIKRNEEGKELSFNISDEKIKTQLNNLFEDKKQTSLLLTKKTEKLIDGTKETALKEYKTKKNFWEFDFNIFGQNEYFSVSLDLQCDSDECSQMTNICFDLLDLLFDLDLSLYYTFSINIQLLSFLDFAIVVVFKIEPETCIGFGPTYYLKDSNENHFNIDVSGGISVSTSIDCGLFFPSVKSAIKLSFTIGLDGILVSGRIGVKLSIYSNKIIIDTYFEFKAFEFLFYVKFKLSFEFYFINIRINFSFSYYLYYKKFKVYASEYHIKYIKKDEKYKKELS